RHIRRQGDAYVSRAGLESRAIEIRPPLFCRVGHAEVGDVTSALVGAETQSMTVGGPAVADDEGMHVAGGGACRCFNSQYIPFMGVRHGLAIENSAFSFER